MQDYYILWTYSANYADKPIKVSASNPDEAVKNFARFFSSDFQKKAKIYCFSERPISIWNNGKMDSEQN